jgi:DNA polymerase
MAKPPIERADPPPTRDLAALAAAAARCTACPLYRHATQTVFGEGAADADVVLVGEQPGDEEDLAGRPFVGPAGRLLDRALADAGIARERCWVTNAVKHFKWTPRGKRRIHERPTSREVAACRPWLEAELASLAPQVVVCLGATAATALVGPSVRVTRDRGRIMASPLAERTLVTVHPSAILRAPDEKARHDAYAQLVADLTVVRRETTVRRGTASSRGGATTGGATNASSATARTSAAPSRPSGGPRRGRSLSPASGSSRGGRNARS